jgi:hypothetical protein
MQDNYGPSSAPLVDAEGQRPRSSLAAIVLGGLVVDVAGSMLFVAVLASVLLAVAMQAGGIDTQIETVSESTTFTLFAATGGSLLVVAGGYTAAWWARRRPIAHALGAGALSLLVAAYGFWLARSGAAASFWIDVASLALHLPLAALGGYLYGRSQPLS